LEKNKDQLHPDVINVIRDSTLPLIKKIFPPEPAAQATAGKGGASKKLTLGGQFKNQLNDLINTLNATFPHFVRCMKSNDKKSGNIFTSSRMQDQLRYAGLVEVCRIRKLGFPVRRLFDDFYKRFKCCDLLAPSLDKLLASLKNLGILKDGEWAKGKTRVFMRTAQASQLELAREASLVIVTIVIQKYSRRFIFRCRYKNMLKIISSIRAAITKREEKDLHDVIDMSAELPFGGGHLNIVKEAKVLVLRIQEEKRVVKILENALLSFDISTLKSAISTCQAVSPPFYTPLVQQAKDMIEKLEREAEARANLKEAINKRDLEKLILWIQKAQDMGMETNELPQAIALKNRIEQENELLRLLVIATNAENLDDLNKYSSECIELGLDGRSEVKAAKAVVAKIYARQAELAAEAERQRKADEEAALKRKKILEDAERKLAEAKASNNAAAISSALQSAMQLGIQSEFVQQAQVQLASAQKQEETKTQLMAAVQVLQVKSESGMVDGDLDVLNKAISSAETVRFSFPIKKLLLYILFNRLLVLTKLLN
jgi:myosin heavy subunit